MLGAYRRADAAAESNLTDAQTAYRLGGGTLLQVVDAQRQVNQERRNLAIAQGQRLSDIVTLYMATAADWRAGGRVDRLGSLLMICTPFTAAKAGTPFFAWFLSR